MEGGKGFCIGMRDTLKKKVRGDEAQNCLLMLLPVTGKVGGNRKSTVVTIT